MTETMTMGRRKSVRLTKPEHSALKQYRKKYNTAVECAISIGIDRIVLNNVILKGSGSPETIEKIKSILPTE